MKIAVYDSKPHDRQIFLKTPGTAGLEWFFIEARLNRHTAGAAAGCRAACIFVNDKADASTLKVLAAQGVKHLALRCAGYNQVDLSAATKMGIRVSRVPAYSPHAVAEHAVALLLTLNRKIHRAYLRVLEHDFRLQGLLGWDLAGKTVGIIGTGRIGQLAAQAFVGFSCKVVACDPKPNRAWARRHRVRYVSLDSLLTQSDVISLHAPLNKGTHHLIGKTALARMKLGAFLINTSRGGLVNSKALIGALKKGRLGGVALDVYEEEEGVFFEDRSATVLDDQLARLLSFPNVLVTSHQGYFTREALAEIGRVSVANLKLAAQGKPFLRGSGLS